jgi:glycosyltransferase involved in cell wall biosynthesis
MKYSFVLITFNEKNTIVSTIQSIMQLNELKIDYEIIVVDDGSTDNTAELVTELAKKDSKIKIIGDGHNHGRGYGRNLGVESSKGDFVVMIDSDIILPIHWLRVCLEHIKNFDVVGGIAVPDGDVAYVYRRFKLRPKTVMGSTTITGNNGLYRRAVFSNINFAKNLREGEDVDFNHRLRAAGFTACCIPGLTVEHQEHKSFAQSVQWLYQSGIGATRQLFKFKEIRLADIAFAATIGILLVSTLANVVLGSTLPLVLPYVFIGIASFLHLKGKFHVTDNPLKFFLAVLVNMALIASYYCGRVIGIVILTKNIRKST